MNIKEPTPRDLKLVKFQQSRHFLFHIPQKCVEQCVESFFVSTEFLGNEKKCLMNCFDNELQVLQSIEKNL